MIAGRWAATALNCGSIDWLRRDFLPRKPPRPTVQVGPTCSTRPRVAQDGGPREGLVRHLAAGFAAAQHHAVGYKREIALPNVCRMPAKVEDVRHVSGAAIGYFWQIKVFAFSHLRGLPKQRFEIGRISCISKSGGQEKAARLDAVVRPEWSEWRSGTSAVSGIATSKDRCTSVTGHSTAAGTTSALNDT